MTVITFATPGTLDMRAFTTMGMSAKPNTDRPIGVFGTGLKYAVAVLTRLGASFSVYTGGHRYWFETTPVEFRGGEFQQIVMRRDSWTGAAGWRLGKRQKLPFTTQYGRNWEPWMAFRELYANTLDENGVVLESEIDEDIGFTIDSYGTFIRVSGCPQFVKAYQDREDIFLDLKQTELLGNLKTLEVYNAPADKLFYQGLRAKDLPKPTKFLYNFISPQDLTEDRQLAHEWRLKSTLANAIATCDDEDLIDKVITVGDRYWEHDLSPDQWIAPSAAFRSVMARRPRGLDYGWGSYYASHDDRPEVIRTNLWRDALRPWIVDGDLIKAADGTELFSKPYEMNPHHWSNLAASCVDVANASESPQNEDEVEEVEETLIDEGEET